jgi:hypothetical protein
MHITGEGWHCIGSVSGRGMAFRWESDLNGDEGEDTSVPRSTEVSMAMANTGRDDDMARSCKSLRALKKYVRRR